jgi:ribokinase
VAGKPRRVTVVGSYIVAVVMDMDRLPVEGESVIGRNYHTTFGGKGSNAAVCAARLGADTYFLGRVGRDAFAADFVAMLEREGVHREKVLYSEDLPTGIGIILFNSKGTNLIAIDPGANNQLSLADVNEHEQIIRDSAAIISPLEIPLDTALAGARIAKEHGVKAILNPAPACDLRKSDLSCVFAVTPNETESRTCLGLPSSASANEDELAMALLELGPENVILTLRWPGRSLGIQGRSEAHSRACRQAGRYRRGRRCLQRWTCGRFERRPEYAASHRDGRHRCVALDGEA